MEKFRHMDEYDKLVLLSIKQLSQRFQKTKIKAVKGQFTTVNKAIHTYIKVSCNRPKKADILIS